MPLHFQGLNLGLVLGFCVCSLSRGQLAGFCSLLRGKIRLQSDYDQNVLSISAYVINSTEFWFNMRFHLKLRFYTDTVLRLQIKLPCGYIYSHFSRYTY